MRPSTGRSSSVEATVRETSSSVASSRLRWVVALTYPLIAVAPSPLLLGVALGAFIATGPIYDVVQFSYRSRMIPDELQGRVNSAYRLIGYGFQPVGAAVSGMLIVSIGASHTVLVFAAVGGGLALVTTGNERVRNACPLER